MGGMLPLAEVIAAVEAQGERLRAEFYRAQGPRGRRGSCPLDREIEESLRASLTRLVDCAFAGEETEPVPGARKGELWLVDPHDGTFEFMSGRRGSAISVALVRGGVPVLGVVHAPDSPDRGHDTIAWAEGAGPMLRNGEPVRSDLSRRELAPGELVFATASSAQRPETFSRAASPARYVAMPSIAYRMARVAAGDGIATVSLHGVHEYDIAAGMALIRAAGGVCLDAQGRDIELQGDSQRTLSGCFAGAPQAARHLQGREWSSLEQEPRREVRTALGFPRRRQQSALARAQGCLAGHVIGDALASQGPGAQELADGGAHKTIAGQPTDAGEMAITLARSLVRERRFDKDKLLDAYRTWLTSRPVEVAKTTERGLLGLHTSESESNGSLMRIAPVGIWGASDPQRAARTAREDSALTHPNPVCLEACAGYAAAIAAGVGGGNRNAMLDAAIAYCAGPARAAILLGAESTPPAEDGKRRGSVFAALQNAFFCLFHDGFEAALARTAAAGGDAGSNAAIACALIGAARGREAIPPRWLQRLLACRPLAQADALRPRPIEYWPDDILELAEALLNSGSEPEFQKRN